MARDPDRLWEVMRRIAADSFFATVQEPENELYIGFWNALKDADLSRRFRGQTLDSAVRMALEQIADDGAAYGVSQKAQALLRSTGGIGIDMDTLPQDIECIPAEPANRAAAGPASNPALPPHRTDFFKDTEKSYLRLSPNPARDYVSVEYAVAAAAGKLQLRVLTAQGKVLSAVSLSGPSGTLRLPVEQLPSGIYLIEIHSGGKTFKQAKLQVLR